MPNVPFPGCEDRIHKENPKHKMCLTQHCTAWEITDSYHDQCVGEKDPLKPQTCAQCLKPNGDSFPICTDSNGKPSKDDCSNRKDCVAWDDDNGTVNSDDCIAKGGKISICWCCCACYARGTPIATPDGIKAIEYFYLGDTVSGGSCSLSSNGKLQITWQPQEIKFSNGTDGGIATMIFVGYGKDQKIIVTPDHLFLLSNGKFQRADRLVPQSDKLVSSDGEPVDINEVHAISWDKGLHHIATTLEFNGSTNDHLLNSNGIITGDYCLQLHQKELVAKGLMEDPYTSPVVATKEYMDTHAHLDGSMVSALVSDNVTYIPEDAGTFLTAAQEEDIKSVSDIFSSPAQRDRSYLNYLFTLYKSFFPDITFYLDDTRDAVNTYSFYLYDKKHVVVAGKLLDLKPLNNNGYAFIIAQAIVRLAALAKDNPVDANKISYVGVADFHAGANTLRRVFSDKFDSIATGDTNALDQMKELFSHIEKENQGDQSNIIHNPPLKSRIQAIQNGLWGGNIPVGVGLDLKFLSAAPVLPTAGTVTTTEGKSLNLTFNMDLNAETIEETGHYVFTSDNSLQLPKVLKAKISSSNPQVINLTLGKVVMDQDYSITVNNIKSTNDSALHPKYSTQTFKFTSKPD